MDDVCVVLFVFDGATLGFVKPLSQLVHEQKGKIWI